MKKLFPMVILLMMVTSCAHFDSPYPKERDLSMEDLRWNIRTDPPADETSGFGSINFDHWALKINIFTLFKNVAPDFSLTEDFQFAPEEELNPCVRGVFYF